MASRNPSGALHPTVFLLIWAIAGVGLHAAVPLPMARLTGVGIPAPVGAVLDLVGGALFVWAQLHFRRVDTPTDHTKPTTTLVTSGPFRFSRNPMYIGLTLILLGTAIVMDNGWWALLVVPFVAATDRWTIRPEERYLQRAFPEDYGSFRRSTRRWL